jgi:outer membrane protein TolC
MKRQFSPLAVVSAVLLWAASGCHPQQPFYFSQKGDTGHYVGVAQQIEYPDLETASLSEVEGAKSPLTLDNPKPDSYWDLTLQDAMQIALANSTVIKSLGGVQFGPTGTMGNPTALTANPAAAATIYLPAQTEADPRLGVEAALSAFDAQLSSSIFWENNVVPENSAGLAAEFRPPVLLQQTATGTASITKTAATGDQFQVKMDTRYNKDNTPQSFKRYASEYDSDVQFQFVHPFLRGAGVGFNRIAGPGALPGQANGVVIARLRTDQSLADFEGAVRNLASDVERSYWNLYYTYRRLDSAVAGRDAALQTWRQAKARYDVGGKGGGAQDEAQARQQYLLFKGTVEQAQSNLYKTENIVRYMLGLTHSDGRLIRPADEPTKAKVEFEWSDSHAEALVRAVEIRRQKWVVKQREMELIAAKNYLLPQLNAVGRYGWNGMGDLLIDPSRELVPRNPGIDDTLVPRSAFGSMTSGDYPAWHLEMQFAMPFGFRREMAGVRAAQLTLVRERKVLQEQELELSHLLADAFRDLSQYYQVGQTSYNRWLAADKEVQAVDAAYKAGTTTLDQVLDAQRRKAEAENEYYRTLIDYNLAITQIHFRKGSLLEYNGIFLAEGPWPAKAYFDARRRARHADASHYVNYGFTQPRIISQGPYEQFAGQQPTADGEVPAEAALPAGQPGLATPEAMQSPEPLPKGEAPATRGKTGAKGLEQDASPVGRIGNPSHGSVVPGAKVGQNGSPRKRGYDIASTNVQGLGGKAAAAQDATPAVRSPVEAASYQQAAPRTAGAGGSPSPTQWKSVTRSVTTNEPDASPSSAAADSSASGWKSVQH